MAKRATKDVFKVSKKDSGDTSWMCGLIDGTELDSAPELLGERQETAHILGTSYFLYFLPLGTFSAHSRHTLGTPGTPGPVTLRIFRSARFLDFGPSEFLTRKEMGPSISYLSALP